MKKSLLFILLCTIFTLANVTAQKNVINMGFGGLALGNISLNYERTFGDSRSASLTAGFLIPRKLPSLIYDYMIEEDNRITDSELSGFFIMPEYRFYPTYKIAPEGFYIAPFFRLNYYTLDINGDFYDVTADIKGKFTGFGGGVQFGMHWVIKEKVSIDFYLAGMGIYYNKLSQRFESDDPDVDYDVMRNRIENTTIDIPIIGEKIEVKVSDNNDYVDARASFLFPGFRSGISLGIVF